MQQGWVFPPTTWWSPFFKCNLWITTHFLQCHFAARRYRADRRMPPETATSGTEVRDTRRSWSYPGRWATRRHRRLRREIGRKIAAGRRNGESSSCRNLSWLASFNNFIWIFWFESCRTFLQVDNDSIEFYFNWLIFLSLWNTCCKCEEMLF